ncbi:uncharacterized protein LOC126852480 [Cataglyphis hispanica]|uniref:uncharacterized protein LOC126852480 n=1 Tax=Cataglyphis hispanica TaxID=1086592 RepID=UPI002180635A|nr:uncharacterized protein LOC126852480 [Cataglyphis hispanica]
MADYSPSEIDIISIYGVAERQISRELNVSPVTVNRILRANYYHPYISIHQQLSDNDEVSRVRFCRWALDQIHRNPIFFHRVMFSDEVTFKNNGGINRHNSHYYSENNPYWTRHIDNQYRRKINVWCSILDSHIIGLYFFDGNVTAITYLNMLQNELSEMLEAVNLDTVQHMWIQQDGASPHFARIVTNFLNATYEQGSIGRNGYVAWPPRSSDLSLDFFLWGYLKDVLDNTHDTRRYEREHNTNMQKYTGNHIKKNH